MHRGNMRRYASWLWIV